MTNVEKKEINFSNLVGIIKRINEEFTYYVNMAVNTGLTLRNWLIETTHHLAILYQKVGTASPQLHLPTETLISKLAYSHFELLIDLDEEAKRAFYEIEAIKGGWSVRELKRQINSLYYERSGLSINKRKLSELAHQSACRNFIMHKQE